MSIGLNVVAAAMIWALVVYYLLVGWVLRFPGKRATVMTLYQPPAGISPALAAYFLHPGDSVISLATCLVDLAQRGSIRLKPVTVDGYYVEPADDSVELQWWEREVRERLSERTLSAPALLDASALLNSLLEREVVPRYVSPHNFLFSLPLIVPVAASLQILSPLLDRSGRVALVVMAGVLYWAAVSLGPFGTKPASWNPDNEKLRSPVILDVNAFWLIMLVVVSLCLIAMFTGSWLPLIVAFVVGSFLGRSLLRTPTREGWELYTRLQGFKYFMSSVEADSINQMDASAELPQKIQDDLAFAVAFGLKPAWGGQLLLFLSHRMGGHKERELT